MDAGIIAASNFLHAIPGFTLNAGIQQAHIVLKHEFHINDAISERHKRIFSTISKQSSNVGSHRVHPDEPSHRSHELTAEKVQVQTNHDIMDAIMDAIQYALQSHAFTRAMIEEVKIREQNMCHHRHLRK